MLGLGSIGYVQSFQYVLINIEPVRPSDYSQFVFLALCVFDFDIPALKYIELHVRFKICVYESSYERQLRQRRSYLACAITRSIVMLALATFRSCWGFCTCVDTRTCDRTCLRAFNASGMGLIWLRKACMHRLAGQTSTQWRLAAQSIAKQTEQKCRERISGTVLCASNQELVVV